MFRKEVEEMKDKAYQISPSEHRCCSCELEIEPGKDFYSTVCFLGEEFARRTYCISCWAPGDEGAGAEAGDKGAAGDSSSTAAEGTGGQGSDGGGQRPANIFAYWRTKRPEGNDAEAVKIRFDPQVVLEFFRGLGGKPAGQEAGATEPGSGEAASGETGGQAGPSEAQRRDLRFVLSLLLMRKKILLLDGTLVRDGYEWLQFHERVESDRSYEIANPDLSEGELEQVRDAIGELLQMQV